MAIKNEELSTIKKPNTVEYVSREQLVERLKEIKRCRQDIIYFCENYYRIQSLDKGLHVVKLYDVQKDLLNFFKDYNRCCCLASRQSGKSSTYCMFLLWITCFHRDKRILMLAQNESTALELLSRIKTGYEYLPSWLKPGVVEFNKGSIEFTNRSTIKAMASGSDSARGTSANILVLDEFAFLQPGVSEKLWTSVYPVVSSSKNGKVIIVSTPNGKHNLYYDIWKKASNINEPISPDNEDGFRRFRIDWWQVPGRDEKWKSQQIQSIGKVRFAQEFDNQFLDDATTTRLITDDVTDKFRQQINEFKVRRINQGKNLFVKSTDSQKTFIFTMYHDFDPTRTYLATADVAEGVGKDSSVLYIWDVTDTSNITMCLKFSDNRTSVLDFAFVANEILKLYANPFLACESNGISLGFIDQLYQTYEYQNIVMMGKNGGPGIDSHYTLKTNACLWTRDMMTTDGFGFEIYDEELLDEFPTFIKKDGIQNTIYSAIRGSHDDHIMPLIWGCWILHPDNVQKYFNVVETFQTNTGVLYPKTLEPYEPYTPVEIQEIREMELVKSFQFYKTKNSNEFLKAHQEKVEERKNNIKGVVSEDDVNNRNLQEIAQKSVLSEDDMIALMRQQTMKEYHQKTQKLNIDFRNPQNRQQEQTYGKSRFFGVWDGNISNQMSPNEFNTFWKTSNPKRDAFDVMFGFDDPDDDGLVW